MMIQIFKRGLLPIVPSTCQLGILTLGFCINQIIYDTELV